MFYDKYHRKLSKILLASLIVSIDKYANTTSVYGAHLKKIKAQAGKQFVFQTLPFIDGISGHVYNQNANQIIDKISGDILYMDPPYNGRQYSTNYHVLETLSLYNAPEGKSKTGLRKQDSDKKSLFCSKINALKELENIISRAKFEHIFISYNNEGIITPENFATMLSKYGTYKSFTKENYKRYKSDKDSLSRNYKNESRVVEYIHYLHKNS